MKIRQVGAGVVACGCRDGRMDMRKLIVALCNFANEPKKIDGCLFG